MSQSAKRNPNCSVQGCKTKSPHLQNELVRGLKLLIDAPHELLTLAMKGLAGLGNSACNDLANRNAIGFICRQRQIQELYVRTLYVLLIAEEDEQLHMLSGEVPNGLASYYRRLNKQLHRGEVDWEKPLPGLNSDSFTIMETLNEGAHVSFGTLLLADRYYDMPEYVMTTDRFSEHLKSLLSKLEYMRAMFAAGKPRQDVLSGMKAMHQPASYWDAEQSKARGGEA